MAMTLVIYGNYTSLSPAILEVKDFKICAKEYLV